MSWLTHVFLFAETMNLFILYPISHKIVSHVFILFIGLCVVLLWKFFLSPGSYTIVNIVIFIFTYIKDFVNCTWRLALIYHARGEHIQNLLFMNAMDAHSRPNAVHECWYIKFDAVNKPRCSVSPGISIVANSHLMFNDFVSSQ